MSQALDKYINYVHYRNGKINIATNVFHQVKGIPSEDLGLDKNYDCGQHGNKDIEHNNIKLNYACLHIHVLKSSSDLFCKLKKKRFF